MSKIYYWWYAYGHFDPGEGNFPCIGQVIRHYRNMRGIGKVELARSLECTVRYIEMLENDQNITTPQLISRRVLLAKTLQIPPILLGLSSLTLCDPGTKISISDVSLETDAFISPSRIGFYEGILALSWEFYYTSSIERAAKTVDFCFEMLNDDAKEAKGVQCDQIDAERCRFYRLSALIARERNESDKALEQINEAVSLAQRLNNAELITSSLIGRIRISIHRGEYEQAFRDAELACTYADTHVLRDPLRGKCYQMMGETQAYFAGNDKILQDKSIAYFDKAGHIARKGNHEPDGSFVKTDLTSIYIERAKALRLFRRFDEAHNAFAIARKNLSPELTRWQVNLLIEEAKTYFLEQDIESCCSCLIEAIPIVQAIHLCNRIRPIYSLLEQCMQRDAQNMLVKRLEKICMAMSTSS